MIHQKNVDFIIIVVSRSVRIRIWTAATREAGKTGCLFAASFSLFSPLICFVKEIALYSFYIPTTSAFLDK